MSRNTLDRETSPYLLQHKDNPVHWHAWGPEALERAQREDKPVLLSVGYAACHWCHVMAHESFEDDETAALMNELFVNIKVDREERPDIDAIYQAALALLGQHGGWPLTMFLDSDGEPFWGGTYFPPDNRFGRPAFREVLQRIHEVYRSDRAAVSQNRAALKEALAKLSQPPEDGAPVPLSLTVLDRVAEQLAGQIDRQFGGVAGAPKFPHVPVLELLWRAYLRSGREDYRHAVTLSLDRMSQGGIYDHLGGGFARYSTDHYWLVPHFEKMLYDNAQLIDILCTVWQHERTPLYEARLRETVAWVLREMIAEGGAFAATLDADSEGEEGKYYVWREAEIDELLGGDAARFKAAYDVTPDGNWEGVTILNRSARPELGGDEEEAELARLRQILWAAREQRVRPGWDDKVLADWNGLMIAALANAGATFAEPDWIAAAARAFAFIAGAMNEGGRLRHAYRRGEARHLALLDDYATLCDAALALHQVTGDRRYLDQAEAWLEVVERHYRDHEHGGYFLTADDAEALITRTRTAQDNAVPAGNAVLVRVFARLYCLTGDDGYRRRAQGVVDAFAPELGRNVFGLLTLLNGFEVLEAAVQVVIVGRRDEADAQALLATVHQASLPAKVVLAVAPDEVLPEAHPAHGKGRIEGRATAYVCIGNTCSLPVTAPDALAELLRRPAPGA